MKSEVGSRYGMLSSDDTGDRLLECVAEAAQRASHRDPLEYVEGNAFAQADILQTWLPDAEHHTQRNVDDFCSSMRHSVQIDGFVRRCVPLKERVKRVLRGKKICLHDGQREELVRFGSCWGDGQLLLQKQTVHPGHPGGDGDGWRHGGHGWHACTARVQSTLCSPVGRHIQTSRERHRHRHRHRHGHRKRYWH